MDLNQTEVSGPPVQDVPALRRVLSLWDLIFYGMTTVGPAAPVTVFGLALFISHGQAILSIFNGMIAMILTAISYGRMAALYPSAGSAYTYVARGLHPRMGLIAGWAMLLDYVAMPMFCIIYCSLLAQRIAPGLPYAAWAVVFAAAIIVFNLCGIRFVAHVNRIILAVTSILFLLFFVLAFHYLIRQGGWTSLLSTRPLYDRTTFSWGALAAGTSFGALNYLGFDSVTTLAEDVHNPRRNILIATVGLVILVALFTGIVIYLGQLVGPDYRTVANIETCFMDVVQRVGGNILFQVFTFFLVLATAGSGVTALTAAARLLFGFGRDNLIPRSIFARLHLKSQTPVLNIVLVGIAGLAGSFFISYQLASEVLVFGAFIGFAVVNLASIRQFYFAGVPGHKRHALLDLILPAIAAVFCVAIMMGLDRSAILCGCVWFVAGFLYHALKPSNSAAETASIVE
ncbi:MAG: APC family permease [Terracidiphilus sp.]|jgi:amino acid transporter